MDANALLVAAFQAGDTAAAARLVEENRGLAAKVAHQHLNRCGSFELDDLIQEGCLGILRAAATFDGSRGVAFTTYCWPWVRQHISRAIQNLDKQIRIPVARLYRDNQGELPEAFPIEDEALFECYNCDEAAGDAFATVEERAALEPLLAALDEREECVIAMRFGLQDGNAFTLAETARALGLSREGIRNIERRALGKLREAAGEGREAGGDGC